MNKKNIFFALAIFILVSCGASSPSQGRVDISDISRVNIPDREQGYSNLKDTVIHSRTELDLYLQSIKPQAGWNNKAAFVNGLQNEPVPFDLMNILIYFHTEGSGSIGVSLAEPVWEGGNAVIAITRTVPEIGTADMAYYAYAFTIKKTIPKVIFTIGDTSVEIISG